jgi:large subunit ribosomal protein L3
MTANSGLTAIIGRKVGMTQVFGADGAVTPVTVLKAGPCVVVQTKSVDRDGYEAVQIGFVEGKAPRANKAMAGHYAKANVPPTRIRREVKVAKGASAPAAGSEIACSMFAAGETVDVIGTSKGKGFQGVIKRHNFRGGAATHGSMFHRAPGSIGASSYPSRVVKGMRAAGHMGYDRVTVHNLKIVRVDGDNHLLLIKGAVPGPRNGIVVIRKARKAKPVRVPQVETKKGKK